jgi:hypothetical protein
MIKAARLLAVKFSSFAATRRHFKEEVVERSETRWWLFKPPFFIPILSGREGLSRS